MWAFLCAFSYLQAPNCANPCSAPIKQKLHGVVRPLSLKTDVIKKRYGHISSCSISYYRQGVADYGNGTYLSGTELPARQTRVRARTTLDPPNLSRPRLDHGRPQRATRLSLFQAPDYLLVVEWQPQLLQDRWP